MCVRVLFWEPENDPTGWRKPLATISMEIRQTMAMAGETPFYGDQDMRNGNGEES